MKRQGSGDNAPLHAPDGGHALELFGELHAVAVRVVSITLKVYAPLMTERISEGADLYDPLRAAVEASR